MRLGGRKARLALIVLVLISGYGVYRLGWHLWGMHHYAAAQEAIERRDFLLAGSHLEKCLAVWPHDASLRLQAARTARRRGDFDTASRELRLHERENGPGSARLRELQLRLVQQGNETHARSLLETYAADPEEPEAHLILEAMIEGKLRALEHARDSDKTLLEGALAEELSRAQELVARWLRQRQGQADQIQGLIWRGKLHLLGNEPEEAIADFRRAVEHDPDHFDSRLQLARALTDSNTAEAARHFETLHQRDPRNEQVAILLASSLRGLGQILEAQQILDEMLAANPDHFAALIERGKLALDAGRAQEAEPFLRRGLARAPNDSVVLLALSRCLHLTGKEDEAKHLQRRYTEIESERTRAEQDRAERERTLRNQSQKPSGSGSR